MDHKAKQKKSSEALYAAGVREHVVTQNVVVHYLVRWRLRHAVSRFSRAANAMGREFGLESTILVMCAGEGLEGTVLCDMGFSNVTISDLSPQGVAAGLARDKRLKGFALDAEVNDLPESAFDLVVVQDGLHHLPSPIQGFTSMLRIAAVGAIFLEPHDSLVGRLIGTKWERNGEAINYVFRWTSGLVDAVANSFLGPNSFESFSFAFWHHNVVLASLAKYMGGGAAALTVISLVKKILDVLFGRWGNQFAAVLVKINR